MKNFKDIIEDNTKGVTFTFGRFNPPTVGHMKLANKMKTIGRGQDIKIYTSHTTDKKKAAKVAAFMSVRHLAATQLLPQSPQLFSQCRHQRQNAQNQ